MLKYNVKFSFPCVLIFFKFKKYLLFYMCEYFVYMSICGHLYAWCPRKSEKGIRLSPALMYK